METAKLDSDLDQELRADSGWWRVDWQDGRATFFRHRDKAMALTNCFSFVLPTWVQELPTN